MLPDLASRLRAAPCVSVLEPDDTLLAAVMVKLFADRQLKVGEEVIAYILPRLERSFAAVRDFVEEADRATLSQQRALTVPVARDVLQRGEGGGAA